MKEALASQPLGAGRGAGGPDGGNWEGWACDSAPAPNPAGCCGCESARLVGSRRLPCPLSPRPSGDLTPSPQPFVPRCAATARLGARVRGGPHPVSALRVHGGDRRRANLTRRKDRCGSGDAFKRCRRTERLACPGGKSFVLREQGPLGWVLGVWEGDFTVEVSRRIKGTSRS